MKKIFALFAAAIMLAACNGPGKSVCADPGMWCSAPGECCYPTDVFYLVSTDVLESFNEDGLESPLALLNDEEKSVLSKEINFIHKELFPDSLNFFAPYYHQITLKTLLSTNREEFSALLDKVGAEICGCFDYYMANMNNGRPFVLAGFSQGASLVEILLNHMTDEQYGRMVAAYMIGYGLDSAAIASPHIRPAADAFEKGVTVSYNSARDRGAIWDFVLNDACTCINPVNWSVNATPASFEYDGDMLTATIDTVMNIIRVDGYDPAKYKRDDWGDAPWPDGNYHHFEILFYNPYIRQNVLDRIHGKR